MQQNTHTYLRFVRYKDLNLWDVKRFWGNLDLLFSSSVRLKDILSPHFEPVSKEEMLNKQWHIISKINFAGKLFLRDVSEAKTFKGNLNKIDSNTLIYSKINVKHGCIYFHPDNAEPFGVSSEYPAYKIDASKVSGAYLVKVIQSQYFKTLLNQKTSGISKARVKPYEFLDIKIPLPSLSEQQTLIKAYNDRIQQAETLEKQAEQIGKDINAYFSDKLKTNKFKEYDEQNAANEYNFLRFVRFKNLNEWGINLMQTKNANISSSYQIKKIREVCSLGSGGTPSRSTPRYYKGSIPWIKTGEVLNEEIFETEEHITQEAINNSSAKLYPKGSLIIAMYGQGDTRGRTAKIGIDATTNQACAVLYDINNNIVITDYLWYYLQKQYNDLRSLASGNNQPNLNAGKIKNYDIVIPPIDIQKTIVKHINKQKEQIKQLKQQAENLKKEALEKFEKEIFE